MLEWNRETARSGLAHFKMIWMHCCNGRYFSPIGEGPCMHRQTEITVKCAILHRRCMFRWLWKLKIVSECLCVVCVQAILNDRRVCHPASRGYIFMVMKRGERFWLPACFWCKGCLESTSNVLQLIQKANVCDCDYCRSCLIAAVSFVYRRFRINVECAILPRKGAFW